MSGETSTSLQCARREQVLRPACDLKFPIFESRVTPRAAEEVSHAQRMFASRSGIRCAGHPAPGSVSRARAACGTVGPQADDDGLHEQTSPDQKAIEIVKASRRRLAATPTVSFVAVDTFESQDPQGTPLVYANTSQVTLQRPDKLRVILSGDSARSQFYCNRNTTMTYSPVENALVIAKAPPTINQCLKDAYKASKITFRLSI